MPERCPWSQGGDLVLSHCLPVQTPFLLGTTTFSHFSQALKKWYRALGRGSILFPDTLGARNPPNPKSSQGTDVSLRRRLLSFSGNLFLPAATSGKDKFGPRAKSCSCSTPARPTRTISQSWGLEGQGWLVGRSPPCCHPLQEANRRFLVPLLAGGNGSRSTSPPLSSTPSLPPPPIPHDCSFPGPVTGFDRHLSLVSTEALTPGPPLGNFRPTSYRILEQT